MEVNIMAKFEREVEIDSQVEKVWQVLTNTAYWPQWFPGMTPSRMSVQLKPAAPLMGGRRSGPGRGEFLKVVPQKKLVF
jgi:uncharacterized protein YndB with AHSA1/START domain